MKEETEGPADFIGRNTPIVTHDQLLSELQSLTRMASLQLDALRLTPDRCGLQAQSLQSTCLQATLSGSYAHIKSFLNDLQSRHPNQLIVRGLRMQQRDATLGTVGAELDLLLIGGGKAVEGRGVPSEAVRATP